MKILFVPLLLFMLGCKQPEVEKPNVILVMADDLGWGDTGFNGNPVIRTPHLDQMAKDGIRFNRFYSAAPVCSPTRASCLTGRHPYRTGVFFANTGILRPEEITLAEVLKAEGYSTGHFGKWHLGTFSTTEEDANRGGDAHPELFNPPTSHGFDTYFSTESKVPTWDPMLKPAHFDPQESQKFGWNYIKDGRETRPYGTAYWTPGGKATDNLRGDDSRVIMDRAIPFIEKAVAEEQPFFAVIWFHTPHLPVVAGPKYAEMYKDQDFQMRQYAGSITAMDEQVGRLRSRLKEIGADENTMIWFCSDNGPEGNDSAPGLTGGFKGRKRSLHEGGVRVPAVMVWPGVVAPAVVEAPVVTSDYLPTILDILGIELSEKFNILDGESVVPLLQGKDWEREAPIGFASKDQFSFIGNRLKLYGNDQLYDLTNDPFETTNLADDNPDIVRESLEGFNRWYLSCGKSFAGEEYGTESFGKVKQRYPELEVTEGK